MSNVNLLVMAYARKKTFFFFLVLPLFYYCGFLKLSKVFVFRTFFQKKVCFCSLQLAFRKIMKLNLPLSQKLASIVPEKMEDYVLFRVTEE